MHVYLYVYVCVYIYINVYTHTHVQRKWRREGKDKEGSGGGKYLLGDGTSKNDSLVVCREEAWERGSRGQGGEQRETLLIMYLSVLVDSFLS